MAKVELISYIPQIATYQIFYPRDFILHEAEDGILSITSPETNSNLTISSYQASQELDEKGLTEFFEVITKEYIPLSEIDKHWGNKKLLLEKKCKKADINWIWWALSELNQIIIFSVNSDTELTPEDYNLYKFMINQVEIYPSEFED